MSKHAIYLDCSFAEKDQVKALGAQWDGAAKKWLVPSELYPTIDRFNLWRPGGKVYFNCPFSEKDDIKQAGAKWNPTVKAWCISSRKGADVPAKFERWLSISNSQRVEATQRTSSKRRGNAQDATIVRVNENMTVVQLQDECRWRKIKSISGKNKEWLLEQLGVGSVWQSIQHPAGKNATPNKKTPTKKAEPTQVKKSALKAKPKSKSSVADEKPTKTKAAAANKKPDAKAKPKSQTAKKNTNKSTTGPNESFDWNTFPRISSSMTVAQLTHELLRRLPGLKGTSNKSKTWFLEQLAIGSIWTTSPDVPHDVDFSNMPVVSSSLTIAQIMHELMSRDPSKTKGLSSKSKSELLKLAGVGSVWTTGTQENAAPVQKVVSAKETSKKTGPKTKKAVGSASAKEKTSKRPPKSESSSGPNKSVSKKNEATTSLAALPVITSLGSNPTRVSKGTKKKETRVVTKAANGGGKKKPESPTPPAVCSSSTSIAPVSVKSSAEMVKRSSSSSTRAPVTKKIKTEANAVVTANMTMAQLKNEMKARNPNTRCPSGKNKEWLISFLGLGTELHSSSQYKAKQDAIAAALHTRKSPCHHHLLADSSILRAKGRPLLHRIDVGRCDIRCNMRICHTRPYLTCESCNWDICKPCYEIQSLPEPEQNEEMERRLHEIATKEAELQRRRERHQIERERQREAAELQYKRQREARNRELFGDDLARFSSNIRKPSPANKDANDKLKYTVWVQESDVEKDFDSSFASIEEANLRIEYIFYYQNPWGCEKDEMYANKDIHISGGFRYLRSEPDGGESLTVSAFPSEAFEALMCSSRAPSLTRKMPSSPPKASRFAKSIRKLAAASTNKTKKLRYTIWTSCGYDNDGWHSYQGPPEKVFNSSFATLEQANQRAEYVFYYENPWGLEDDDELPFAEIDTVTAKGFRLLECRPDDSERWTVSVIPSSVFEYINL